MVDDSMITTIHTSHASIISGARCNIGAKKCPVCDSNQWRSSDYVVVANVYVNDKWDRLEIIHLRCYRDGNKSHPPEEFGSAGTADEYARALSMSGTSKNISVRSRD